MPPALACCPIWDASNCLRGPRAGSQQDGGPHIQLKQRPHDAGFRACYAKQGCPQPTRDSRQPRVVNPARALRASPAVHLTLPPVRLPAARPPLGRRAAYSRRRLRRPARTHASAGPIHLTLGSLATLYVLERLLASLDRPCGGGDLLACCAVLRRSAFRATYTHELRGRTARP